MKKEGKESWKCKQQTEGTHASQGELGAQMLVLADIYVFFYKLYVVR